MLLLTPGCLRLMMPAESVVLHCHRLCLREQVESSAVSLTSAGCLQGRWLLVVPAWWQYVALLCIGPTLMAVLGPALACTHRYLCHMLIWSNIVYYAEFRSKPDHAACDNTLVMLPWAFVDAALLVKAAFRFAVVFKLGSVPWGLLVVAKVK